MKETYGGNFVMVFICYTLVYVVGKSVGYYIGSMRVVMSVTDILILIE